MKRIFVLLVLSLLMSNFSLLEAQSASFNGVQFVETFDGDPSQPFNWSSPDWEINVHFRNTEKLYEVNEMQADHGADCSPPPTTHTVWAYEESVYNCKNHLMTASNGTHYGVIYMMPRYLVDFTDEEAIISFDISTIRQSGRDWVDIWLTPFEDHLQNPLQEVVDLQGPPKRGIQFKLNMIRSNSKFRGFRFDNHQATELSSTSEGWKGYEYFLTPDARRRDTFELRISKTHVKFGMPDYDFYWFDLDIDELDWTKAVVQLGHHSYNPTKDCDDDGTCGPGTWHWDNVQIEPALPFTLIKANSRFADEANSTTVTFDTPSPSDSFLRFSGIGLNYEFSTDNGSTWQVAERQSEFFDAEEHFSSYFTPFPAGESQILLRADDWWGGPWHARNISVVSEEIEIALPIELSDFELNVEGSDVQLSWTTLTEMDNSGFFVEMKEEVGEFQSQGFVEGLGDSQQATDYQFAIEDLAPGRYEFRLRQVDFSGQESYSEILEANIEVAGFYLLSDAFPNPFSNSATFTFASENEQDIRIELSNKLGQLVELIYDGEINAGQKMTFDLDGAGLSTGTYFYRVVGSETVSRTKAVSLVR